MLSNLIHSRGGHSDEGGGRKSGLPRLAWGSSLLLLASLKYRLEMLGDGDGLKFCMGLEM